MRAELKDAKTQVHNLNSENGRLKAEMLNTRAMLKEQADSKDQLLIELRAENEELHHNLTGARLRPREHSIHHNPQY